MRGNPHTKYIDKQTGKAERKTEKEKDRKRDRDRQERGLQGRASNSASRSMRRFLAQPPFVSRAKAKAAGSECERWKLSNSISDLRTRRGEIEKTTHVR